MVYLKNNPKKVEIKNGGSAPTVKNLEPTVYADFIELKAVGYPFDFNLMENDLKILNKDLFEAYAREQWLGLVVCEGSYLFDQKIVPDFSFQVVKAEPNGSTISDSTKIKLIESDISKNNHTESVKSNLTLVDVVGQVNAKNKTRVLMKYIQEPERFGQWAPKNILFHGLPGTGKTMLVKALANELEVPLYLIKATSLIGDHVGDGASKIEELFEKAQKNTPAIIFIDEIDAIALHRSFQSLRGDVTEIVNALLTEMDGISENESVVTIGATNNPLLLDNAVRSRFEEEIEFTLPDDNERKMIFENYLKTYPLDYDFDLERLVKLSKNMSGRDIKEKVLKTALHHAISNDKTTVEMSDIDYALKNSKVKISEVKGMFE